MAWRDARRPAGLFRRGLVDSPLVKGAVHPTAVIGDVAFGPGVSVGAYAVVHDGVTLGEGCVVGPHVILGEPLASFYSDREYEQPKLQIGRNALLRSGTIIYAGTTIGDNFESGHRATIRESTSIGHNTRVGTLSDLQGHCTIGDYVRIHSNVFVAPDAAVEDFAWLFPHVVLTNDPHPPSTVSLGVRVRRFAAVGAGAVLLPGVTIGPDALVGAGAVVRRDVPAATVVVGNPAREIGPVSQVRSADGAPAYPWREHFSRGMPWDAAPRRALPADGEP